MKRLEPTTFWKLWTCMDALLSIPGLFRLVGLHSCSPKVLVDLCFRPYPLHCHHEEPLLPMFHLQIQQQNERYPKSGSKSEPRSSFGRADASSDGVSSRFGLHRFLLAPFTRIEDDTGAALPSGLVETTCDRTREFYADRSASCQGYEAPEHATKKIGVTIYYSGIDDTTTANRSVTARSRREGGDTSDCMTWQKTYTRRDTQEVVV
eukprot:gb/GECG01006628.1/.p1 GENE.gb/GECG01006628.1/~~gb/GECG01006628.1/.p1  ORF type:complete len:207 (+),score=14.93 gb/GECG01006628.1/:1-621(+)